jgi:ATP-dependent RNA helicase DeaD
MKTPPISDFSQFGLADPVLKSVQEIGYETPSAIQQQSIPPLLAGRDILGQAQTGTGKTAAFALALLSRIDVRLKHPQLLILTPTRELALQVAEAVKTYARYIPKLHILPIYGGQPMATQLKQLQRGAQVVVGTPGRIMDHLRRKTLKLDNLVAVTLDEADEMLRMGFIEDITWILEHTPAKRQVALFSATMPKPIEKIAHTYLQDPVKISIQTKTSTVEAISQRYWQVSGVHKLDALTRILEAEPFDAMIIFVRTKTSTIDLTEKLEARGFACGALNGDMNQKAREQAIEHLKRGKTDIVIATDVAARGLDVERITHVINYDVPHDTESYVHRIGRTGRAGRTGTAILFVAPREKRMLKAIEKATRQSITPMNIPSREDVANKRIEKFYHQITATLESEDLSVYETVIDAYQSEHNIGMSEIAAALAFLARKDKPLDKEKTLAPPQEQRVRPAKSAPKTNTPEPTEPGMVRYRLDVGHDHGVEPKHIVGAIANEAGIEGQYISGIHIYSDYSTVDLPEGMPKDIYMHLKKTRICGQKMNIRWLTDERPTTPPRRKKRNKSKKKR